VVPTVATRARAHIRHPDGFTRPVSFRGCPTCLARNIVRDGDFTCPICGADLPTEWNLDQG
jgi:hypothetical protein